MVTTRLLQEEFWPGDEFGDYRLLERIGLGGEGSVWSAWDKENHRVVAVKFFSKEKTRLTSKNTGPRTGFLQDLDHVNIRKLYQVGNAGDSIYFSMAYYPSGSLDDLLVSGALSTKDTLLITAQIANALEYIHAQNIVHRDLKPTNILLDADLRTYLTDFGIARKLSDTTQAYHTGHGTFRYSPPEQHTEAAISRASDFYSLGIMIYEMLTGTLPWEGDMALAIRQLDTGEGIPDPQEVDPDLPADLIHALRRLTDMDARNRPATAAEAFGLVAAALNNHPLESVTHEWGQEAIQQTLKSISFDPDPAPLALKEAQKILSTGLANWAGGNHKLILPLTRFTYLDAVFSSTELSEDTLNEESRKLMARASFVHNINKKYWWRRLGDPHSQIQLCEQVIGFEQDEVIGRVLSLMLEDQPKTQLTNILSPAIVSRLIDMSVNTPIPGFQMSAFNFIEQLAGESGGKWAAVCFSQIDDTKLGKLALLDSPQGLKAAQLIGKIKSDTAVNVICEAMEEENIPAAVPALVEIMRVAHSLPSAVPGYVRRKIWGLLTRKQLTSDRVNLTQAYLAAAFGAALGIGYTIFATYRLPAFLDTARVLNSLGSGLFFGPLIGLGIFLTRLIVHRLQHTPPVLRLALSILIGGTIVNLSFFAYHFLFLDSSPHGWLITFGSFLMIAGFGIGAQIFSSRTMRALTGTVTTALGLGLSWLWSTSLAFTPMIYYEPEKMVESFLHITITSLMIGILPHVVPSLDLDGPTQSR
ncbi:MAG: bifunctional serine/threonine protein kinase/MFS transporter [Anaerolineales bacterium]